MFKVALPSVANETITLVKDTALVSVIGLSDLMELSKKLVNSMVNVTPYIIAAAIYLGFLAASLQYTELSMVNVNGLLAASALVAVLSIFIYSYSGVYRPMRAERATFYVGRLLTANFTLLCFYLTFAAIFSSSFSAPGKPRAPSTKSF